MKTKITVGIDNKPSEGLKGEWDSPEKDIRKAARDFLGSGIEYIGTGHCTKDRAFGILKEELGERIEQFSTGMVKEF